jgi:uncharacterized protein YjiS (DUF1127 family)
MAQTVAGSCGLREAIMTIQWLADWIRHQRERAELDSMQGPELQRLARDVGVSTYDLERLVDEGHDPEQLSAMLKAIGLDEAALKRMQPAAMRDLQRLCSLCEVSGQCQRALKAGTAASRYHEFCVNADTFDALKVSGQAEKPVCA